MKKFDTLVLILVYYLFQFARVYFTNEFYYKGKVSIETLDVGQGDAILVTTPRLKRVLIDGGPSFEVDYSVFKRQFPLWCKLDVIILTHPHFDHLAGLNRVLQRCEVGLIIFNNVTYDSDEYEKLWKERISQKKVISLAKDDQFDIDGLRFIALWPDRNYISKVVSNINNASIVLLLDYSDFEALFLGDVQKEVLAKLDKKVISRYLDGRLEFLKVSHHGSSNGLDEDLLAFVRPKVCAISSGAGNPYGHPHVRTIAYLKKIGCGIYRTDKGRTLL